MQSDPKESHNTSSLKWMEPNWPTCPALGRLAKSAAECACRRKIA
jgi:hypothetical protein